MASETTTTSANDPIFSAWVDDMIFPERRPANVSRPFYSYRDKRSSNSFQWNTMDDPGLGNNDAAMTEGTGASNTQLATSSQSASLGTAGVMATITDELDAVSVIDAYGTFGEVLKRSLLEKYETDFCALQDGSLSNSTSTSGIDLTGDTFWAAHAALLQRDVHGQEVFIGHPVQTSDLQRDVQSSLSGQNARVTFDGVDAASLEGYQFEYLGIPVYQTSLVSSANSSADRAGALFIAGKTFGLYEVWGPRTEMQRDASLPGTEIVVTSRYGVVEIQDAYGQAVVTDA